MLHTEDKIIARIYGNGRGWSFSPKDFQDLGSRSAVDKGLSRLCRKGMIRRVLRGIYDYPRASKTLNMQSSPDIDQVAHAIARSRGWQIQATGVWAENLLGLSTQVPAKAVYMTSGKTASFDIDGTPVQFRHVSTRDLEADRCGLVIQGLKSIGESRVDARIVNHLRRMLPQADQRKLTRRKQTTCWVYDVIKQICSEPEG